MSAVFFAQLKELTVRVTKLEEQNALMSRQLDNLSSRAPLKPVLTVPKKTA
jgi:hypothetical protein